MRVGLRFVSATLILPAVLVGCVTISEACTGIRLKTRDGAIIYGRTMEFADPLKSQVLVIPRGKEYVGIAPGNRPGLRWTVKYGIVGANAYGFDEIVDGINEKGLVAAAFYHPDYAKYQTIRKEDESKTLAPWEFPTWLLSSFATVAEAKQAASSVKVGATTIPPALPITPPLHYILHDATGACAVIEFTDGEMRIFDNPLGVITNAPTFDWHLTNLRNYVNLSPTNVPPVDVAGIKLGPLGQGSGWLGLPGDYTPPSRFIRAVAFSQGAEPAPTAEAGVNLAAHILNTFDIFAGAVRSKDPSIPFLEITQWTVYADITNKCFYFKTYDDQRISKVDLTKLDFGSGKVLSIPMGQKPTFDDVTAKGKPSK
ncbi:linear amide C-N hydrolase [Singulisphaera sp. PoT]|uniref:linear amide C-N hydrolase n=1 Tax=Singulisphaera sp. PoT TaxID=3411797 RepID=UPI003BF53F68